MGTAWFRKGGQSLTLWSFFDNFGELGQIESVTLWRFLTWLGLNVPLPMLNGHSRLSFWQEYGTYRYLDLFSGTNKKARKAELQELPVELQEQLAGLVALSETADYEILKAEEDKLPLSCMQNEQIKIFLAVNRLTAYDRIGDQEKKETAEKELRKMILVLVVLGRNLRNAVRGRGFLISLAEHLCLAGYKY